MPPTKSIGHRITYVHHPEAFTAIITQRIPRGSFALLIGWWLAWWCVGGVFMWEWATTSVPDERMFFAISLAFWAYFAFRVGKVIAWRRWGKEFISITRDEFSVKNAFGTYGRAQAVPLGSVERMEVVQRDPRKFLQSLDQSFWIMGGDSLVVRSSVRRMPLGKQLNEREAGAFARVVDEAIRRMGKAK